LNLFFEYLNLSNQVHGREIKFLEVGCHVEEKILESTARSLKRNEKRERSALTLNMGFPWGLDFGNQNCALAVARKGGIDVIDNEASSRRTP
jgi:hypothetical protein